MQKPTGFPSTPAETYSSILENEKMKLSFSKIGSRKFNFRKIENRKTIVFENRDSKLFF